MIDGAQSAKREAAPPSRGGHSPCAPARPTRLSHLVAFALQATSLQNKAVGGIERFAGQESFQRAIRLSSRATECKAEAFGGSPRLAGGPTSSKDRRRCAWRLTRPDNSGLGPASPAVARAVLQTNCPCAFPPQCRLSGRKPSPVLPKGRFPKLLVETLRPRSSEKGPAALRPWAHARASLLQPPQELNGF